jgi:RHS repeat-associated protein
MARHRRPHRSSPTTVTRNRPPTRKHIRPRPLRFEPLEDRRVLSILGPTGDGSSTAPLGLPAESPSAQWLFPGEYIPVGRGPYSLAAADLNGNGILDAVTANYDDNTVSVLIGRGDGSFEPQTAFEVGAGPYSVAVADINGDGIPDLVTANYNDNTVSVLAGRGDGTFEPQTTFEVGGGACSVAVADLNDDGIPDLVTANYNDNTVSVLVGRGDGTFEPQTTFDVGVSPWSVAIADLNGNGIPDLVTANYNDNAVSVLMGHGDATFAAHRTFDVGHQPTFVAIADLNGNGIPDLVTADYREYTISVLMGRGDGIFEEQTTFEVANRTEAVAIVDVNRDGIPDLVTAEGSDGYISVLIGQGDGTFAEHATFQPGTFPMSLAIADLNGDGIPDLLTGNYGDDTNTVAVLLGFGDGTFEAQTTLGVGQTPWSWPYAVAVADLNGDGVPDLIAANSWEACVSVLTGRGDGTFEEQTTFEVGYNPYDVVVTDLNGDGVPDVVTADRNNSTVSVLLGLGGGAFEEFTTYEVGPRPMSVAVADLNGDGVPDLVTANENDHTVSVLLGLGDGTFAAQTTFGVGRWPSSVAIADLDGDGIPDVVTTNRLDATVSVLLGLGDGAFGEHVTFGVGLGPQSVAVADLNGDGAPDLVTANEDGGTVSVLLGLGDGTFGAQTAFEVGGSPMTVIVSDVDRNGVPDLITANNDYYGTVSVLAGRGDGTFEAPRRFAVGIFPQSVAVADLNGDGAFDLVAANGNDDTLSVLLGRAFGVKHFPSNPVAPPVVALEIRFPQPMDTGSFSLADDIDSFTGPSGTITPSEFSWLSNRILQIKFPDQTTAGHYEMVVGPMILDAEGNSMDEPYVATFTIHAPQVTGHSPSGKVLPPVDSLQLSFTHPMDKTSFSLDEDIVSFTGPEGNVAPTGFAWQDDTTLHITFAPQWYFGSYQLVLAPSVYDIYGNLLDQDRDGVGGEPVEDRYAATFATRYMGTMTQDTTWGPDHGVILVDGMVTVAEGVTLTIEPGTVVQFDDGASLHVAGLLDVQGSVENPVILTSIHDHSAGGGPSGADPAPGDWMGLHVRGTGRARLEHFEIRYATNAIDANDAGAKVDLTGGILRDSSQYGIYVWSAYVDVTAENVVIANNGWTGVFMRASSRGTFTNCTIVGNGFGGSGYGRSEGIHHGAVTLTLDNVTVAFNANGILYGGDPPEVTIRHSLFWNPDGQEYINPPPENRDFLERDGNLRANPLFVNREAGNYELSAFSPAIDAGRGLGAPATDILGRPRFDDLGMPNVGTGYPPYVDIGAYERQEHTVTGDLAVLHVATPHPIFLSAGEDFTVQWTVANVGAADCAGPWTDTVYLSRRQHFGADAVPLGTFTYQGDLAPGERYTGTLTGNAPSEAGVYYVIVRANAEGSLAEPVAWNNVMTGTHVLAVDLPVLEVGQSVSGTVERGRWDYVRLEAEPGNTMVLTLEANVQSGATGLYVRYGAPPTLENYDARAAVPNRTDQELRILSPREGVYFVGVYGTRLPYGSTDYVLSAEPTELAIHRVSPGNVGNVGPVTLEIVGDNFSRGVKVMLVGPDGVTVIEGDPWFQDASTLYATFDLSAAGAAPGVYDLSVTQPGVASVTEFGAVTVMMGGAAVLSTSLTVPGMARPGRNIPVTVSYVNAGRVDLPSPLMTLQGNWDTTWFLPSAQGEKNRIEGDSVTFLALSPTGPAAVLRPGQRASFTITVRAPLVFGSMEFALHAFGDPGESGLHDAIDWARLGADLRPADLPDDAWNPLLARLEAQIGTTWGDYLDVLRDNANHLAEIGQRVYDTRELLAFEFVQAAAMGGSTHLEAARDAFAPASGLPLSFNRFFTPAPLRRARLGPLGRGWVHSYHIALDERSDGTIVIDGPPVGSDRVFLPDRSGGYRGQSGDNGTLSVLADGRYLLTEQDGLEVVFRANGQWDSMEDTNGNRVTSSYDADGRLTTVTHSNGDRFHLEYDASGLLAKLIDHADRETQYVYDSSGKYLLSVTRPDGESTTYTYLTGVGALLDHHLTSITRPGGLQVQFTYDELGRLAGQHVAEGEEAFRYAYSTGGKTTVFDAFDNATTTWLDSRGRTAMIEDPLRERMHFAYDVVGNLAGVTGPTGLTAEFLYDRAGNLLTSRDPLGRPTDFGYGGPYDKLLSVYDARGNAVQYAHDGRGNVTRITYEDGSHEDFQYDGDGNLSAWTNRRGETITYTHNARGQVTAKNVPDTLGADEFAYKYDTVGRLTSATGPEGTTAFTYDPGTQRLVRIDYPAVGAKAVFLAFEYDAAGRRTKSTDQDGHVLNYFYDGAGRLVQMTDGADELVVDYEYDAAGRLVGKTLGNEVYTVYTYDAVWQLMSVLNYQADNTVLSRFEYTYDGAGRRIAMDTHYGRWTYRYDDAGQLVRAALVSTDANVPDEDLTYVYDAVGNRIRTVSNGETTEYTTNNMNQYVQVGERTYLFDADGNLIEETGFDGATTYTYDHENRLIAIARGDDAWQYAYDALGNRIAVQENDAVTRYIVDPIGFGDIVGEYDAVGAVIARYQHGYGLLARIPESGAAAYYTFDAIGSTSELTGPDGTVENVSTYMPFGATVHHVAPVANPFGFVGEWGVMEDASGLHHMRNRAYAPQIGRFTSADPIGLVGGDVNLLRYVGNSPIMAADPLGLFEWDSVPNAYKLGSDILSATEAGIRGVLRWGEAGKQYLVRQGLVTSTAFKRLCKINSALSVGGSALSGWDIGTSIHAGDYANATRETALLVGNLVAMNPKFFWVGWALRAWDAGTQQLFDWWFSDTDDVRPPRGPRRASGRTPLVPSWTPEDKFGPAGYDGPGVEPGSEERFVCRGR